MRTSNSSIIGPYHPLARGKAAASLALAFVLAGCGTPFQTNTHVTLTTPSPTDRLVLRNLVGEVTLKADDGATEVCAKIVKTGKGATLAEANGASEEIEITLAPDPADGTTVIAEAKHPKGSGFRQYEVRWDVTAPPGLRIEVENGVGDLRVERFAKEISLRNGVGDAIVRGDPANPPAGPVKIVSGVGSVHVDRTRGDLTVKTDVGNIHAMAGGNVELQSNVGSVCLKLLPSTAETVKVSTDVGDVRVYLTSEQQGRIVADCDVGSLRIDLDSPLKKNMHVRRNHARAEMGDSDKPVIDLSTDVGDVYVGAFSTSVK